MPRNKDLKSMLFAVRHTHRKGGYTMKLCLVACILLAGLFFGAGYGKEKGKKGSEVQWMQPAPCFVKPPVAIMFAGVASGALYL